MASTIIIAEDHALFRSGLRQLLSTNPKLYVIAEVGTAEEAINLCHEMQPNLLLLDVALPSMSGLEAANVISKKCPNVKILIISMFERAEYVRSAFRAGARGYLLKTADSNEFFTAIDAILRGEKYVSSELEGDFFHYGAEEEQIDKPFELLTAREQEILICLAKGLLNKEIAQKFFISEKTVVNHRTNFMRKLSLHNTREITMFAVKYNLITID